jgi:hypothetical protein
MEDKMAHLTGIDPTLELQMGIRMSCIETADLSLVDGADFTQAILSEERVSFEMVVHFHAIGLDFEPIKNHLIQTATINGDQEVIEWLRARGYYSNLEQPRSASGSFGHELEPPS